MITAQQSYSGLEKFFDALIEKTEKKAIAFFSEFIYQVTYDIAVNYNPVGDSVRYADLYAYRYRRNPTYKPVEGLSHNNWQVSIGFPSSDVLQAYGQSVSTLDLQIEKIKTMKLGDQIYVNNNVDYIGFIGASSWLDKTIRNQNTVISYFNAAEIASQKVDYII